MVKDLTFEKQGRCKTIQDKTEKCLTDEQVNNIPAEFFQAGGKTMIGVFHIDLLQDV